MKLTVDRAALVNAVKLARPAVASRPGLDLLGHFLLSVEAGGQLTVAATDLETMVVAECAADVAEGGRATVPAPLFAALLAGCTAPSLTLALDKGKVRLTGEGTKLALPTLDPDDFPAPERWGALHPLAACSASIFRAAVAQVAHAAADPNSAVPALTGIHLAFAGGALTLVGFDSYRYASASLPVERADDGAPAEFIIPAAALAALAAALPDGDLLLGKAGNTLALSARGLRAFARVLDGPYPNPIAGNLPDAYPHIARIPRAALRDAVRLASLVAPSSAGKHKFTRLHLTVGPERVAIAGGDSAADAEIAVPLRAPTGGSIALTLDADALSDALGALNGDDIELRATATMQPVILAPAVEHDASLHVIAPMNPD